MLAVLKLVRETTRYDGSLQILSNVKVGFRKGYFLFVFAPFCFAFSVMIERVPEWSSPHIAKCGFVIPKGPMSWILVAASNYTR